MARLTGSTGRALLLCGNDGAMLRGGRAQVTIPGGHDEVWILDRDGRCEMDCVVAAQRVPLGEFACGSCEGCVEADHVQLIAQLIDASDRAPKGACVDSPASRLAIERVARAIGLSADVRVGRWDEDSDEFADLARYAVKWQNWFTSHGPCQRTRRGWRLYRKPPRNDLSVGERFLYEENLASRKPCGARADAGRGMRRCHNRAETDESPRGSPPKRKSLPWGMR